MSAIHSHRVSWSEWRRTFLVAILLCGSAFLAAQALDGVPAGVEPFAFVGTAPSSCDPAAPPTLHRADGTELTDLTSIRLNSNAYLVAQLCVPTMLRLTAEGTAVDGVGARLAVHLGDTPLFDDDVTGSVELVLEAPFPDYLLIAFTNDLYRPPLDRNLWLRNIELVPLDEAIASRDEP